MSEKISLDSSVFKQQTVSSEHPADYTACSPFTVNSSPYLSIIPDGYS